MVDRPLETHIGDLKKGILAFGITKRVLSPIGLYPRQNIIGAVR